jgi:hypothetical protein
MCAGFTGGVTAPAHTVIRSISARPRIFVRVVARRTSQLFAFAKTAAGHKPDWRESHINRIFELRFIAGVGARHAVAFSADLRLRNRRQTSRIQ